MAIEKLNGDRLLDELYSLSGNSNRAPDAAQFYLVATALHHAREDVRERAAFIGGLRWMDKTILGYFKGSLISGDEPSDNNRRLMIECLVSEAVERGGKREVLERILIEIQRLSDSQSLSAKAAFVGVKRLNGEISKAQFAALDYDDIQLDS